MSGKVVRLFALVEPADPLSIPTPPAPSLRPMVRRKQPARRTRCRRRLSGVVTALALLAAIHIRRPPS